MKRTSVCTKCNGLGTYRRAVMGTVLPFVPPDDEVPKIKDMKYTTHWCEACKGHGYVSRSA